jgi:hypothetical protein
MASFREREAPRLDYQDVAVTSYEPTDRKY